MDLGTYVESKASIMKQRGRAPNCGDAVVYGWNAGDLDTGPEPGHEAGSRRTNATAG